MRYHLCVRVIAGSIAACCSASAMAQSTAPALDKALTATRPAFSFGPLNGYVDSAQTTDCRTILTLDNGKTFGLGMGQMALALGPTLSVGDLLGNAAAGFTGRRGVPDAEFKFQGDHGPDAATAAEQIINALGKKCAKSAKPSVLTFDFSIAAEYPTLQTDSIKLRVVSAQTVGCVSYLLLEDGSDYKLDLTKVGVVGGATLVIDFNAIRLTYTSDKLAEAANQARKVVSGECLGWG